MNICNYRYRYPLFIHKAVKKINVGSYKTLCAAIIYTYNQREGMVLLEYQPMPSLRGIANDDVLCTFSNTSAPYRGKLCDPSGKAAWTVHLVQNHTLPAQPASRVAVVGHPSIAFGLIAYN